MGMKKLSITWPSAGFAANCKRGHKTAGLDNRVAYRDMFFPELSHGTAAYRGNAGI